MFEKLSEQLNQLFNKKEKTDGKIPKVKGAKFTIDLDSSQKTVNFPETKDKSKVDFRYPLIVPYAYAHISWDEVQNEIIYKLEEPILDQREKETLVMLEQGVKEFINMGFIAVKEKEVLIEFLEKNVRILLKELNIHLDKNSYLKIMYYIYRDFIGLNRIEPLMNDLYIEDIECNGKNSPLYIVHRKYGNIKTNIVYKDFDELSNFVEKLAQKCGRFISYSTPIVDGVLPSGDRVNATYTEDVSSKGPTFCFADGYLQLNDGRVKDIKEFFKECKKNFGFKIENENEVVELNNLGCCGVDEKDLKQYNSKLKTVIKLKPPKKLVNVKFKDGSEITTTTNHLFHVANNSLDLIEAKNLKKNMFVPMPSKVNVEGCRQTINVANLLKEFSYNNKICITSTIEIKEIVANEVAGFEGKYRDFRAQMSDEYDVHNSYFYEILSRGQSISFEILDSICDDVNKLNDVNVVVYGGGTKGRSKAVKIPKEVDEDLAYLAGAIVSDGYLSRGCIDVSCYDEGFNNAVSSKLFKKFGKFEKYYDGKRIYLSNLFVPYFFNKVFDIPYGKKASIVEVPEIIFKSDNEVVSSFIRGLFDGDGSCKSGLSYKTLSKELAYQLSYLLSRFGIYSYIRFYENMYQLTIPSIYESVYAEKIGFYNTFKISCLNDLLLKKDDVRSFIRYGRVPMKPVLNLIKKLGVSKNKICKSCGVNYNRLIYYDSLSKPFVKKIIKFLEKEFENEELSYLKWLINCDQEFAKIESVNVYDNVDKKPVYDIELEPCKFFIAGNKPMNVFDTIRKFTKEPWSPVKLMQVGSISPEILAYLWLLVENGSNILVVGGTGSGKTTLVNVVAFFIPPQARVVSIEDSRELRLEHENWLPSVARAGIGAGEEKTGEVTMFDLLRESFRQRPDYVIVGEVRGEEASVLFQGMASVKGDEKIMLLNHDHPKQIAIKDLKNSIKYKVISMNPENNESGIFFVDAKLRHAPRNKLLKIETKSGREVFVTEDHSLFTYDKKGMLPVRGNELKKGDTVVIPGKIPSGYADLNYINLIKFLSDIRVFAPEYVRKAVGKLGYDRSCQIIEPMAVSDYYAKFKKSKPSALKAKDFIKLMKAAKIDYKIEDLKVRYIKKSKLYPAKFKITKEFLRLLGYYLSEGTINDSGRNNSIRFYNKNEKILEDMKKCIKSVVDNKIRERVTDRGFGSSIELSFTHKVLFEFIKKYCGKGSLNKKIPDFVFGLNKEKIGSFLTGMYNGDGWINDDCVGYCSISRDLIDGLSKLLLVYGIVGRIRKKKRKENIDYTLVFYTTDERKEFLKYVNLIRKNIKSVHTAKINPNKIKDVYLDKIKNIEEINLNFSEPVYDISVPGVQNFIGGFGGVLLHNSGHPSIATIHADDIQTVIRRLQTPPINLSPSLVETLDIMCLMTHAKVKGADTRKVSGIQEILTVGKGGDANINVPFKWDPKQDVFLFKKQSNVFDKIVLKKGVTIEKLWQEFEIRRRLMIELFRRRVIDFSKVQKVIHAYYKTPEKVLKEFGLLK